MASSNLKQTLRELVQGYKRQKARQQLLPPGCPFGELVEQRLKQIERNLQETRTRINALLFLVLVAIIEQIVTRLLG